MDNQHQKGERKMSKKITNEEFLSRFYRNYPEAKVELVEYTAISNPLIIKCSVCGKTFKKPRARDILTCYSCCGSNTSIRKIDKLKMMYEKSDEFEFVKQVDKDHYIVHHNTCGQDIKRVISNSLDNPFTCKFCNRGAEAQKISIKEIQKRIDERFGGDIQILDYNGQLKKNHYKCLKCGMIFTQQHTCLMQSRGCPACDRYKSNGERKLKKILEDNQIFYKEQVSVEELPLQHFDFGVYEGETLLYFIEVQGEQHREEREIFRDNLAKIKERDDRKRQYCYTHNIPLYEIIYQKGKLLNLDILPFGSTTISVKESTL